jgi:hypothetical protein
LSTHIIAEFQTKTTYLPHIIVVTEETHISASHHCSHRRNPHICRTSL